MKKVLLTLMAVAVLSAPVVFAAEQSDTSSSAKQLGLASTGEEIGQQIQEHKDETDSEKKLEIQEEILERAKERARYAVQSAVRKYEQVREKIQTLSISEESQAEIVETLDAQITAMNTISIQIEAATTVDEVKNVMLKTQTQFKYSLGLVKQSIKGVYEDRLANVLENSVSIYDRLVEKVAALEDGATKTELEVLLSEASSLLVSAETKLESGDLDGAKTDLTSAKEAMSEVVTTYNGLTE